MDSAPVLLPLWFMAALVSATIAAGMVHYAHRYVPLDIPGRHSSHAAPTPRGGGIGIALALVAALLGVRAGTDALLAQRGALALALAAAFTVVGAVGFIDDVRGLSIRSRLVAHLLAALVVALAIFGIPGSAGAWLVIGAALLVLAWSINLHNFMDGANGLLAAQAVFVLGSVALIARGQDLFLALLAGTGAAAALAFLPFNFPRARIFLGDAGSGVLGLAIGAVLLLAARGGVVPLPAGMILVSAFAIDATLTLASRIVRGRRWQERHREHLYQWLLRSDWSHARVLLAYAAWNLAVALPLALWSRSAGRGAAMLACAIVYGVGVTIWFLAKSALHRARQRR